MPTGQLSLLEEHVLKLVPKVAPLPDKPELPPAGKIRRPRYDEPEIAPSVREVRVSNVLTLLVDGNGELGDVGVWSVLVRYPEHLVQPRGRSSARVVGPWPFALEEAKRMMVRHSVEGVRLSVRSPLHSVLWIYSERARRWRGEW